MPKLIVTRSSEWMNMGRAVGIYLDGEKLGTIRNGSTQQFDVTDGLHTFRAKLDWCGSREYTFMVSEDDTYEVKVSSFGYYNHFMLISSSILALHFLLHWLWDFDYLIWLVGLIMPVMLYYITFGRNRYLLVREQNI